MNTILCIFQIELDARILASQYIFPHEFFEATFTIVGWIHSGRENKQTLCFSHLTITAQDNNIPISQSLNFTLKSKLYNAPINQMPNV